MDFHKVTLKSWLYDKIRQNHDANGQVYLGLEWIDEDQLMFKIPWVTTRHPNWERYYKLFHDWASREGKKSTDHQKAKRNFRTVLQHATNHFKHVVEKDEELQTGSYKVYQFITDGRRCSGESSSSQESAISQGTMLDAQYTIPTNEQTPLNEYLPDADMQEMDCYTDTDTEHGMFEHQPDTDAYPTDLYNQGHQQYPPSNSMQMALPDQSVIIPGCQGEEMDISALMSARIDSLQLIRQKLNEVGITEEDEASCTVSIEYNGAQQYLCKVSLRTPCKIASRDVMIPQNDHSNTLLLESVDPNLYPGLNRILENVKGGLWFWYDPQTLSFYMQRECLVQVYNFNMHDKSEAGCPLTLKKKRTAPYCMFSYKQYVNEWVPRKFDPEAQNSMLSQRIEFILGVKPEPEKRGKPVRGVKISIQPVGADLIANCEDPLQIEEVATSINSLPDLGGDVLTGILQ